MTRSPGESSGARPNLAGNIISSFGESEQTAINRTTNPNGVLRAFLTAHSLVVSFARTEEHRRALSNVDDPAYYGELLDGAMDAYDKLLGKMYGLWVLSDEARDRFTDQQDIDGRAERNRLIERIIRERSTPDNSLPSLSEQLNAFLEYDVRSLNQSTPVEKSHVMFGALRTIGFDWLNADTEGIGPYVADPAVNEHAEEFIINYSKAYSLMVSKVLGLGNEDILRLQPEAVGRAQSIVSKLN